ncbi:hypothetical protein U9M48_016083 [Paspalum notatum var. saurae]|uniref:Bifunctional inhibitor/plant lipid transfer protein/seed storage helical domain-containing protein n=1 Tax=Paspalum notatum var. saurae TaxID=547442 RepID=A0AAQ3T5P1_PASNO
MAPSKRFESQLIAMLIVIAVATPSLQPSAAFSLIPPIFPCIPGLPRIPLLPCVEPSPVKKPTECRSHLMKMMPCAGYLTNSSVTVPPSTCCEGFNQVSHDGAAICYCHVANGDINQLLPSPMNSTRMLSLATECRMNLHMEALVQNCNRTPYVSSSLRMIGWPRLFRHSTSAAVVVNLA